jgi:excisionase family DNA binding protein
MTKSSSITIAEAARALGHDMDYIYKLVRADRLRATKVGKTWHVDRKAVEERKATKKAS